MKCQVSKKQVQKNYCNIIAVGYCSIQYLLEYFNKPFAYSAGFCGWSCDYYEVDRVCISTGYNTIGRLAKWELIKSYEEKAKKIIMSDLKFETKQKKVNKLLSKFIVECTK